MIVRIQVRRGTSTEWTDANPVLSSGEFGYETDTRGIKIGDGSSAWNDLGFIEGTSSLVYFDGTDFSGSGTIEDKIRIRMDSYVIGNNEQISNTDDLLQALGKLQAQISSLSSGVDGREVELQKSATHVQWRYVGETVWVNLIPLTDLKGDQGIQGLQGEQGPKGDTGEGIAIGEKETNTVTFEQDWIIGNAAPRTGNVLFDFTGAKLGASTMMIHQDASAFTLPAESVVLSGTISDSVANYIYLLMVNTSTGSEKVHVTISQEL